MDKAKSAVSDFLHKSGRKDTTVDEHVSPAVQHETITPSRREETQTAIDREVHQDHYHTSVQPIQDREVLPEQHHHNVVGVEHRTHDHDDGSKTRDFLEREKAKFQNTTTTAATQHSQGTATSVVGEHTHHHVHENIQPVVEKETLQPHVVHTTVPVHEVHHNAAQHHSTSALPAMSMSDYKNQGGELTGRGERHDVFDGEPKAISGMHGSTGRDTTGRDTSSYGTSGRDTLGQSTSGQNTLGRDTTGRDTLGQSTSDHNTLGHDTTGRNTLGQDSSSRNPLGHDSSSHGATSTSNHDAAGLLNRGYEDDSKTSNTNTTSAAKPSLLDRLNPMKDTDGDGKKGMMS